MKIIGNALNWIRRAKPADWLRLVKKLLPHAAIVMSGMLIVFFAIDRVNKPMGFMTNEFHKRVTFALALISICLAIQTIASLRRRERAAYKKRLREAQEKQRAARPGASQQNCPIPRARGPVRAAGAKDTIRRS